MSDTPINPKVIDGAQPASRQDREKTAAVAAFAKRQTDLSMEVKVYSPFHDYYDGPAFSISAENATGPFDILPRHHNFITLLGPSDLIVRTVSEGERRIQIAGGIMHVKADKVIVFLDI